MSISDNIKRAKLLSQQNKAREKQVNPVEELEKDLARMREKAKNENLIIVDRVLLGKKEKISSILLEMIKPVLLTAHDEDDARGIVSMGIVAWNCGIIKQTMGQEKLSDALKAFKSNENSKERLLLDEYINLKCSQFGQYTDFITDFQISFEHDGKMNFTVLTGVKFS